jgi:hypothetical protein
LCLSFSGNCEALDADGTCEKFITAIQIYVIGTIENNVLKNRTQAAFESFGPTLLDLRVGLEGVLVFDEGFNKGVGGTNATDDNGVEVATVIGVAAGGLAFMLLLILLIQRNHTSDDVSHLEDKGDDTFIKEFGDTATNPSD